MSVYVGFDIGGTQWTRRRPPAANFFEKKLDQKTLQGR